MIGRNSFFASSDLALATHHSWLSSYKREHMVPNMESARQTPNLGEKIRALRHRLKLTLDDTATAAGISKPFLSQVERGLATPSLTSLAGIATALGVQPQYFVDTPSEERTVRRAAQLSFFSFAGSANLFARLTSSSVGSQLESLLVKLPAGQTKAAEVTTHAGEEFVYLIEGELDLTLEGKTFSLARGRQVLIMSPRCRTAGRTRATWRRPWCGSARHGCFNRFLIRQGSRDAFRARPSKSRGDQSAITRPAPRPRHSPAVASGIGFSAAPRRC
jgi:transcriptional regulator with XRE-family HTH domain